MASRQVFISDLATVDDIARKYHMSQGQVANLVCGRGEGRRKSNFPQPLVGKKTRAVWLWSDVEEWYRLAMPKQQLEERRASKKSKKEHYVNQPLSA